MNSQPPQVSTLDRREVGILRSQRAFPVVLLADVGTGAVESVCPAVKPADERLSCATTRVLRALGGVDEPPTAVHADVVVGLELVGTAAHDDDRVVEDVVGEVAADVRDFLDAADLLPDLSPQLVAFGAGVVLGDVRVDADGHRIGKLFGRSGIDAAFCVGHTCLLHGRLIALRKDSSLRNNDVLSAPRCVHFRFRPPSTSSVCPVM